MREYKRAQNSQYYTDKYIEKLHFMQLLTIQNELKKCFNFNLYYPLPRIEIKIFIFP